MLAGLVIAFTGATIADPIISIVFAALVLWSSWGILTESVAVLLEATPAGLDLAQVTHAIEHVEGVLGVHDLHVWTVASGLIAGSCHIVVADQSVAESQVILDKVAHCLEHDFAIHHSTIQVEAENCGGHDHTAQAPIGGHHSHHHGHGHHHDEPKTIKPEPQQHGHEHHDHAHPHHSH